MKQSKPVKPTKPETKKLAPGSEVRLRSGGPTMTIDGVWDDGTVTCLWFVRGPMLDCNETWTGPSEGNFSIVSLEPA